MSDSGIDSAIDYRHPNQLRAVTWTAVAIQVVHLILVAYFIIGYDRRDPVQDLSIAMSVSYVVTLCLPAVFLWGVYAITAYTSLFSGLSANGKTVLLVGLTIGLTGVAYVALALYGAVLVVLYAPH